MNKSAIYIGGPSPESTKVLSETLLSILNAPHCDERTKQLALKTLGKGVEAPSHCAISNCNLTMPENHYYTEAEAEAEAE